MAGTSGLPHQAPRARHPKRVCNTITHDMPDTRTVPAMRTQQELNRTPATKSHDCQTYPTATETRCHTRRARHVQQELNNPPQTRHACYALLQMPVMAAVEGRKQPSCPSCKTKSTRQARHARRRRPKPKAPVKPEMLVIKGRKHPSCTSCPSSKPLAHYQRPKRVIESQKHQSCPADH